MIRDTVHEFMNGITQGFVAPRGWFASEKGKESTAEMISLGINWVALVVNQFQETVASTVIFDDNFRTVGDEELKMQIERLHAAGIKVMLKPMIEPLDSIWRGNIRQYAGNILAETETNTIVKWFTSYKRFMARYALIAEETGCEMFCIGCELNGMENHPSQWSEVIKVVRGLYNGPVTYNLTMGITDFDESRRWFRELDILGCSGYFKVAPTDRSATYEEMCAGWESWAVKLEAFHKWAGIPLFFAETGARPIVGAAGITGGYNAAGAAYSEGEQADYYRSTLDVLSRYDWFYGSMWWKWDEHQHRPNYYLPDGHYVGCEPAPAMQEAMRTWCKQPLLPRKSLVK